MKRTQVQVRREPIPGTRVLRQTPWAGMERWSSNGEDFEDGGDARGLCVLPPFAHTRGVIISNELMASKEREVPVREETG